MKTANIRIQDIESLTEFHRHSKAHLKRLKRSGRPELLTVNGKAVVVVQSAAAYQRLLGALERAKQSGRALLSPSLNQAK
jgi:PHD/YefM family antitoxin component YafN of YafNO toxin-antitoxin module